MQWNVVWAAHVSKRNEPMFSPYHYEDHLFQNSSFFFACRVVKINKSLAKGPDADESSVSRFSNPGLKIWHKLLGHISIETFSELQIIGSV